MPWLLVLMLVFPVLAAFAVAFRPSSSARGIALIGTLVPLAIAGVLLGRFDWGATGMQFTASLSWIPALGLNLSVGVDSVALLLIALTALLGPICVLASTTAITHRVRTYYSWLLVLQGAMAGVFMARDLVVFYICFEFTLIPMWVLINLYGSTNRAKAATKFFLFTFTGSVLTLAGLIYVAGYCAKYVTGHWTFDIAQLQAAAVQMNPMQQGWVLLALMAGFAVKVPIFPVHTWLPLAHTEAPTAGSVILAGVLLKLGTYGIYRFALPMAPEALLTYAPFIGVLAIIGIIYAGLICWVQTDVKKLVAYSSVSHLGFCVLGLIAVNSAGLSGSVLYMINHGLSTGALFLLIGMVYERYHTRSMSEMGGLAAKMPVWATFMVFFTMASVGLPGLNGFISEFLCLMGTFQAGQWHGLPGGTPMGRLGPWYALFAGTGMIVAAIYLLYMVGRVVFGPLVEPAGHDDHHGPLPTDLTPREIGILLPLAALCLALGLFPTPVLDALRPSVDETIRLVHEGTGGAGLAGVGEGASRVSGVLP